MAFARAWTKILGQRLSAAALPWKGGTGERTNERRKHEVPLISFIHGPHPAPPQSEATNTQAAAS